MALKTSACHRFQRWTLAGVLIRARAFKDVQNPTIAKPDSFNFRMQYDQNQISLQFKSLIKAQFLHFIAMIVEDIIFINKLFTNNRCFNE